jgi:hypothetical protein
MDMKAQGALWGAMGEDKSAASAATVMQNMNKLIAKV